MPQSESVITLTPADATVAAAEVRPQRSDRSTMLNGSAMMLVAMMLVNIFNFAYNMVMARMLGPGAFGNINAAVTLLLLASCISLAFQLVCAKFVARNHADSSKAAVVHNLLGKAWMASLALGGVLFLAQKASCNLLERAQSLDHWTVGDRYCGLCASGREARRYARRLRFSPARHQLCS